MVYKTLNWFLSLFLAFIPICPVYCKYSPHFIACCPYLNVSFAGREQTLYWSVLFTEEAQASTITPDTKCTLSTRLQMKISEVVREEEISTRGASIVPKHNITSEMLFEQPASAGTKSGPKMCSVPIAYCLFFHCFAILPDAVSFLLLPQEKDVRVQRGRSSPCWKQAYKAMEKKILDQQAVSYKGDHWE